VRVYARAHHEDPRLEARSLFLAESVIEHALANVG